MVTKALGEGWVRVPENGAQWQEGHSECSMAPQLRKPDNNKETIPNQVEERILGAFYKEKMSDLIRTIMIVSQKKRLQFVGVWVHNMKGQVWSSTSKGSSDKASW